MTTDNNRLVPPSKDYKSMYIYQKAEVIFDITYYFVHRFLRTGDRTTDQMQKAARSGKQNIVEGTIASATSKETEIKLLNVAKASLAELSEDYRDYLRTRRHRQWESGSKEQNTMIEMARKHNDSVFYMNIVQTRTPEIIANMAICLLKQEDCMLARHIEKLAKEFLETGGFKERMYTMRTNNRNK